jgi:DNA repair exonuclease SbcCD ATPase subunit
MTDEELVKRLRDVAEATGPNEARQIALESSDRIEQLQQALKDQSSVSDRLAEANEKLTAERDEAWRRAEHVEEQWGRCEAKLATCEKYRDAYDKMGRIGTEAYRELEAKLAKAVEALRLIEADCEADYPPSHLAIKYAARATLAEIEGEKT